ncbi:MAG: hypothetical protein HYV09_26865 [Deltaproteobacteria bacterium]|nr:hypothetical protein [Deltaproteobacteria bacterium]
MRLVRCKDQSHETLEEFYGASGVEEPTEFWLRAGQTMLALIDRLRALPDDRAAWGLTSHFHLILLAEDTSNSPWLVRIVAADATLYSVAYLMPERFAPWPNAYVTGESRSEDEAVAMILKAMEMSKGWPAPLGNDSSRSGVPSSR